MEINLGGESNFTGFEIYDENGRKIKTSRYKETETAYRPVMKRNVCLILGGGFLALYLCTISGILILSYILLSTVGFYFLLDGAYREYKRLQWEAAKKKLIWILENEIPLSFHNLKEAPIEESDCGNIKRKIKEPNNRQLEKALQVGKRYIEYHNSSSLFFFFELINFTGWKKAKNVRFRTVFALFVDKNKIICYNFFGDREVKEKPEIKARMRSMESYGIEIFFANGEKDYLHRGIIHQSLRKYPDETVKEIWYCCQAQLEKTETTNSENISIHFEDMLMELERFMEKRGINIKDKKESQSRWSWLFR